MIAPTIGFVRWAGLILAVSLPLISTQALAASVTVGGITYELGSVTGTYNDNSATLQRQVWWGSESLASAFATAAGSNTAVRWAYAQTGSGAPINNLRVSNLYNSSGTIIKNNTTLTVSRTYMTATATASSVPEINAGSLSQALLILFALWLVTWRRTSSRVA